MDFGISTQCFQSGPLTVDLLERLRKAGFQRLEIHAVRPYFDFHDRPLVRGVARWFAENELPPPSLHLPFEEALHRGAALPLSITDRNPATRQYALDEIKRCLEASDRLTFAYAVLHIGNPGEASSPVLFDFAYAAIAMIRSFSGLKVLLETLPGEVATPSRIREFQAASQLDGIGICYDTGHACLAPPGEPVDYAVPEMTEALHLSDNDGSADRHALPFEGIYDWKRFVENVVVSKYHGPFVLETRDERFAAASECRGRLADLIAEARNSIEEYRLKYKLPFPKSEEDR